MSHIVISLPAQMTRATIILDHLEKKRSESLARQMSRVFHPNEFLYMTDQDLSLEEDRAPQIVRDALYERISVKRTLIDSGYKFTFAFFEEIETLDAKRLNAILAFIRTTKLLLGAPGLEMNSFVCISKARQDTAEAMKNMDGCVERLLGQVQADLPKILLIDALPLKDEEPWIRATVRALNVLGRDNELSGRFKSAFYSNAIWNWTMTEFDVDAREEGEKEAEDIKRLLYADSGLPVSVLQQNYKKLADMVRDESKSKMELPADNIPIPANVIGCCLRKRALQPNVDEFAKQLEQLFRENVTKKVLDGIASADADEFCRMLLGVGERDMIPLNSWGQAESELRKITDPSAGKEPKSFEDYPKITVSGLSACSKVEKMRDLIREALQECEDSLKRSVSPYVKLLLLENIGSYVRREEPLMRRQLEDKLRSISGTMADVQDASDYLRRLGELNEKMMSICMLDCHSQNTFLLISDRTNAEWNEFYDAHLHLNHCEVFNYHSLEEFEFQSLTLTTWDRDSYYKNRERFFRQDDQVL